MAMQDGQTLLRPGDTCWRLEYTERAAFLIDSADYFSTLKNAMLGAQRSIWILAWTFDPLARLTHDCSEGSRNPKDRNRLGPLLLHLASRHQAPGVRVLAWDMPIRIAASQRFAPQRGMAYLGVQKCTTGWTTACPKAPAIIRRLPSLTSDWLSSVAGTSVPIAGTPTCI